jgi:hypothetical protein
LNLAAGATVSRRSFMKRHLLTAAILLMAVAMYAWGMGGGGFVLFVAGGAFELWFWVRALRGRGSQASTQSPRRR